MIIGYSFGDLHINQVIEDAASAGRLRIFIIDPNGVDVLHREGIVKPSLKLKQQLERYIIGVSRRSITSTFENDSVERDKIMRFFQD